MDRRQGIAFQSLVAQIEKTISSKDGVTIESPAFVTDVRGRRREHDILVTRRENLKTFVTAIECKDFKRPVGVPMLEAFRSKCDRTGVHTAVIVSSSGFTSTALEAARDLNIQCLQLSEVDEFPWTKGSPLVEFRRRFSDMVGHYTLRDKASPVEPLVAYLDGEEFSKKRMHALLETFARAKAPPIDPNDLGSQPIEVTFTPTDCCLLDAEGIRWQVSEVLIECMEHREAVPLPASLHRYSNGLAAMDIAKASLKAGAIDLDLTMIRQDDGSTLSVSSKRSISSED